MQKYTPYEVLKMIIEENMREIQAQERCSLSKSTPESISTNNEKRLPPSLKLCPFRQRLRTPCVRPATDPVTTLVNAACFKKTYATVASRKKQSYRRTSCSKPETPTAINLTIVAQPGVVEAVGVEGVVGVAEVLILAPW
ncbi:TPA: hypothetical protein N0F65_010855 [Lagenidium giganteum]|uniref:Uncharacterized protein n=1 Tax=Lagenidium giganteum TaxID=4803 RepID=A0AAV2Z7H6_9STRA|nr:TPA: hypothetical protein N0F65_010855 [Lagenidium giganteum]